MYIYILNYIYIYIIVAFLGQVLKRNHPGMACKILKKVPRLTTTWVFYIPFAQILLCLLRCLKQLVTFELWLAHWKCQWMPDGCTTLVACVWSRAVSQGKRCKKRLSLMLNMFLRPRQRIHSSSHRQRSSCEKRSTYWKSMTLRYYVRYNIIVTCNCILMVVVSNLFCWKEFPAVGPWTFPVPTWEMPRYSYSSIDFYKIQFSISLFHRTIRSIGSWINLSFGPVLRKSKTT